MASAPKECVIAWISKPILVGFGSWRGSGQLARFRGAGRIKRIRRDSLSHELGNSVSSLCLQIRAAAFARAGTGALCGNVRAMLCDQ